MAGKTFDQIIIHSNEGWSNTNTFYNGKYYMKYDIIDFKIITTDNLNYEEEYQEWLDDGAWVDDKPLMRYHKYRLIINGVEIDYYTSLDEVVRCNNQKSSRSFYWEEFAEEKYTSFCPFTCSCGIAGCAGILDGIHLKVRGHSVEWRIKDRKSYKFLEKYYFNFNKVEYFDMIERIKLALNTIHEK